MKTLVEDASVGTIEFVLKPNLRRVTYKVTPTTVQICAPEFLADKVFPLSQDKIEWILNAKTRLQSEYKPLIIDEFNSFETLTFSVQIQSGAWHKNKMSTHFENCILQILYDSNIDIHSEQSQTMIHNVIKFYMRKEAQRILPARLSSLACEHGFKVNKIKINSARTRWGSCTAKKNINLSFYLLLLPWHLIDFVLIHELCHTKYMDHGIKFKNLMKIYYPNIKDLETEMKIYGRKTALFK